MADEHVHDDHHHDRDHDAENATHQTSGERSAASAVAVPIIALGLLAAAVWLGSMPGPLPPAEVATTTPAVPSHSAGDPLPSWNDGPSKKAILEFVTAVTDPNAATFVPPAERVAVFDHDGTLVCEQPILHGLFLVDRAKDIVERRPELAQEEPFATLLTGDLDFVRRLGKKFVLDVTFAAIAGMSEDDLEQAARDFLDRAQHPVFDAPLGDVAYQPMSELLDLLKARGFDVWICSGSGIHFLRPVAERWHGIPPDHVIGSQPRTELRETDTPSDEGKEASPQLDLVILPEVLVLNDADQKPASISAAIGRRPILAVGNVGTAGDIAMLKWSHSSQRPSLQLLLVHDDAAREMAYEEPSHASLDAAAKHGWQVVRISRDWNKVFARSLARRGSRAGGLDEPTPPSEPSEAVASPAFDAPRPEVSETGSSESAE